MRKKASRPSSKNASRGGKDSSHAAARQSHGSGPVRADRRRQRVLGRQQRGRAAAGPARPGRLSGVRLPGRTDDVDPGGCAGQEPGAGLCDGLRDRDHEGDFEGRGREKDPRHQQRRRREPESLCRCDRRAGGAAGRGAEDRDRPRRRRDRAVARVAQRRGARNAVRRCAATGPVECQCLSRRAADPAGAGRRRTDRRHRPLRRQRRHAGCADARVSLDPAGLRPAGPGQLGRSHSRMRLPGHRRPAHRLASGPGLGPHRLPGARMPRRRAVHCHQATRHRGTGQPGCDQRADALRNRRPAPLPAARRELRLQRRDPGPGRVAPGPGQRRPWLSPRTRLQGVGHLRGRLSLHRATDRHRHRCVAEGAPHRRGDPGTDPGAVRAARPGRLQPHQHRSAGFRNCLLRRAGPHGWRPRSCVAAGGHASAESGPRAVCPRDRPGRHVMVARHHRRRRPAESVCGDPPVLVFAR